MCGIAANDIYQVLVLLLLLLVAFAIFFNLVFVFRHYGKLIGLYFLWHVFKKKSHFQSRVL